MESKVLADNLRALSQQRKGDFFNKWGPPPVDLDIPTIQIAVGHPLLITIPRRPANLYTESLIIL